MHYAFRHFPLPPFDNKFIWQVARVGRKTPLKIYPGSDCRVGIGNEFFSIFDDGDLKLEHNF